MARPFFSIITCSYNSAQHLEPNLHSVASQTFRDHEHLIIDGLSTDGTLQLAERYAQQHQHIRIQSSEPHGIANAMNTGIKLAQGQWLLFLNADDCLNHPQVLQEVHDFIVKHTASWYYGQAKYVGAFHRSKNIYPRRFYHRHFFYPLLLFINFINHQATFINKDLFTTYGLYREDLVGGLDYEFWLRIGRHERPKFMPLIVANFRIGGFSSDPKNKQFNFEETIKIRSLYTRFAKLTMWPLKIYQKIRHIS
jgi:glycosyltransferase involved in cell wall biosynthesis